MRTILDVQTGRPQAWGILAQRLHGRRLAIGALAAESSRSAQAKPRLRERGLLAWSALGGDTHASRQGATTPRGFPWFRFGTPRSSAGQFLIAPADVALESEREQAIATGCDEFDANVQEPHLGRVAARRPSDPDISISLGAHGAIFFSSPSLPPDVPRTPSTRWFIRSPHRRGRVALARERAMSGLGRQTRPFGYPGSMSGLPPKAAGHSGSAGSCHQAASHRFDRSAPDARRVWHEDAGTRRL